MSFLSEAMIVFLTLAEERMVHLLDVGTRVMGISRCSLRSSLSQLLHGM